MLTRDRRTWQESQIDYIVNAIAQLNPDAIATAIQLDEELKRGRIRGYAPSIPSAWIVQPYL
jgi:hypothetical protein